jgi:uncharacterized protein YggE
MRFADGVRGSFVLVVRFFAVLCFIFGCFGFGSLSSAWGQTSQQTIQVSKDNRTIAVTASDEASMVADRAQVTVGFTLYGSDQDKTYRDASEASNAIMKALQNAGVKPEAIESTEQTLAPIDDNDTARYSKGLRFVCSQRWMVTVPADAAAATLHAAITAGANNSGEISWQLADDAALEAKAEEVALAHARRIAERMATGLNARLGPVVYVSNQTPPPPGIFAMRTNGAALGAHAKENLQPLAIRPAKISKSVTVSAVFALE